MRCLIFVALLSLVGVSGCQEAQVGAPAQPVEEPPVTFNVEQNPTAEFSVPQIHCEACCQNASEALAKVAGVVDVYASPQSKRVIVAVDEATFDQGAALAALEAKFGAVTVVSAEGVADAP